MVPVDLLQFHHEPFQPEALDWSFPGSGPLSGANGALPWILFERDRVQFGVEFPQFSIERIRPFLPFRYLLSGGVGLRSLVPGFTQMVWLNLERLLEPLMPQLGMFAFVSVMKNVHNRENAHNEDQNIARQHDIQIHLRRSEVDRQG